MLDAFYLDLLAFFLFSFSLFCDNIVCICMPGSIVSVAYTYLLACGAFFRRLFSVLYCYDCLGVVSGMAYTTSEDSQKLGDQADRRVTNS